MTDGLSAFGVDHGGISKAFRMPGSFSGGMKQAGARTQNAGIKRMTGNQRPGVMGSMNRNLGGAQARTGQFMQKRPGTAAGVGAAGAGAAGGLGYTAFAGKPQRRAGAKNPRGQL